MCWYCGSAVVDAEPIGRSARCLDCSKDLRSCRNCRFFLPGGKGDCAESSTEFVSDKERANFCDWFALNPKFRSPSAGEGKSRKAEGDARSAFGSLFND
ncbi:MAG: hypothetical protein A2Z99_01450 [Treponema sp. GWB1_62_6]|nr:MAG: hypothetical protein A2Y36_18040 [Treponema sp. GWA1_62_8]OHE66921.1 MAG: hypothetical protein A2001_07660 [Treponema sp. GWC1_61_84]OHE70213.1 MAG: hypothetical protein A2Z99_01450 [Treponema sp. GWB1_62_6]OHE76371.1 MAG: hypothetical protein A2413_06460 [Treponema sp. RIFOXYC1_FULL_61_9]HCM25533.1 hypothetical protein [Treponema sp.]